MTLPAIQQEIDKIDDLFDLIDQIQKVPGVPFALAMSIAAGLTQYICVRVAGLLEQSMRQVFYTYSIQQVGQSPLSTFVSKALERPRNLNGEELCQLVGRFDADWQLQLRGHLQGKRWDALGSLIANRRRIAHGDPVTVGFHQMQEWHRSVVEVIRFVESLVLT